MNMPWRSWLRWQNSRWVFLDHVLMRLETSAILMFQLLKKCQVSSLIHVSRKGLKPKLIVAASVGFVVLLDDDFAFLR